MKIGISTLFLKIGQIGGTEQMLRGLLAGLLTINSLELVIFINSDQLAWLDSFDLTPNTTIVPIKVIGNRFLTELGKIPVLARKLQLDGIIFPNYFTPVIASIPILTVIHDLNYLYFPQVVSPIKRLWLKLSHQTTLKFAHKTIAISEFVRKDIITKYGVQNTAKIVTIPNPILWSRFKTVQPPQAQIANRFILSVAHQYRHKNLHTLVKAFAEIAAHQSDLQLILVGQLTKNIQGIRTNLEDDIPALVNSLGLDDHVLITGYITDQELAWYYQNATLFAFPSVFEGFGMPPVEALGMGLPVITTNCTAIPEATCGLAQYVSDPYSISEWTDTLERILAQPAQFAPTEEMICRLKNTYAPATIAQQYLDQF